MIRTFGARRSCAFILLMLLFCMLFIARPAHGESASSVCISGYLTKARSAAMEDGSISDWIEIMNPSSEPVSIRGYSLCLNDKFKKMYLFPDRTLQPGQRIRLHADKKELPFSLPSGANNRMDLLDPSGKLVDSVVFEPLAADTAMLRNSEGTFEQQFLGSASVPARKDANVTSDIVISEFMLDNPCYPINGACRDYVELHNTTSRNIDLSGMYLSDRSSKPEKYTFPSGTVLEADGYLVIPCEAKPDDPFTAPFALGPGDEAIFLFDRDKELIARASIPPLASAQACSEVYGSYVTDLGPTPGYPNSAAYVSLYLSSAFGSSPVVISELMADPASGADWIELYNTTGSDIDLSGYGISRDVSAPRKYTLPSGTVIHGGEYLILSCTGKAGNSNGYTDTGFRLSADGGYSVCLADAQGSILSIMPVPYQFTDMSYGTGSNDSIIGYLKTSTPGTANTSALSGLTPDVRFSVTGGVFKTGDTASVTLSCPGGARIYYTLDCTDPTDSSTLFTPGSTIPVSSTTIIRARAYADGQLPSAICTQSYLYDVNADGAQYVVSLVSDPAGLYSDASGILVKGPNALEKYPYGRKGKGANFWMDWEREAEIEFYTQDGTQVIAQGCGIKVRGNNSRGQRIKALKVKARRNYGKSRFDYPLFTRRSYQSYKAFVLRPAGQDYKRAFMRDSLLQQLAIGTGVYYQEYEICVCYLNGKYYSLLYLRELPDQYSVCQFEGWEGYEDQIDFIRANDTVVQGSNEAFDNLLSWIKSHDTNTDEALRMIESNVDLDNFLNYMAIQIFIGTSDTTNVKHYRNAAGSDPRWHWVLFDVDHSLESNVNTMSRWLNPKGAGNNNATDNTLWIACMNNDTIRDRFMRLLGDRMRTDFSYEHISSMIKERYNTLLPMMPQYVANLGGNMDAYNKNVNSFLKQAKKRPGDLLTHIRNWFKFSDAQMNEYFHDVV